MAIAEPIDEGCHSSNSQSANWFNFYLEITFSRRAYLVREFNRAFTVITKSSGLLKTIAASTMFLSFTVASCVLVEKPLNKAVMVGSDPVEFKCKSDQDYRLKWWTEQSPLRQILFDGYSVSKEAQSFCSVENEASGEFYLNLTIKNEAAQTYICHEPDTNKESSADLIMIIDHEAQCETITNTSHVIMTCELEFRGNWAPELEWSYNGTLITEGVNAFVVSNKSFEGVSASIVSNKSVSSTLIIPLSANDRIYTCTAKFDIRGKPLWTTSDNIPDYVSVSVLTVKANQEIADEHEDPFSAGGKLVGFAVGITLGLIAVIAFIIYMYQRQRKRRSMTQKMLERDKQEIMDHIMKDQLSSQKQKWPTNSPKLGILEMPCAT